MVRVAVRVTPRASRDAIEGFDEAGALRVRVTAPPADGAANAAVAKVLARALAVPGREVVLVGGAGSRQKLFDLPLTLEEIRSRLGLAG
jgi:uncharacterized protein (TIGR00251 family)